MSSDVVLGLGLEAPRGHFLWSCLGLGLETCGLGLETCGLGLEAPRGHFLWSCLGRGLETCVGLGLETCGLVLVLHNGLVYITVDVQLSGSVLNQTLSSNSTCCRFVVDCCGFVLQQTETSAV